MGEFAAGHTLKANIKALFPNAHYQRFEDSLSPGIPDANWCFGGTEVWLEGKHVKAYPKRGSTLIKVGLRAEQRVWIKQRYAAGGHVFVWVRCPDGWYAFGSAHIDALFYGIPYDEWREHRLKFKSCKDMLNWMGTVVMR